MQQTTSTAEHLLADAACELEQAFGIRVPSHRWPELELGLCTATSSPLSEALELLRTDPAVRRSLIPSISVPETYFFRHFPHFTALAELARRRLASGRPCRVLSAGCSTGEEVWSAAAVLASVYLPQSHAFEIEGWDLDPDRLQAAERAEYGHWSVRRGLYGYDGHFRRIASTWSPKEPLRRYVRFRTVNLVEQCLPPGPTYDAILFRNVAIYWGPERARRVVAGLATRLAPDGLLLAGPCDALHLPDELWQLQLVDQAPIYSRLGEPSPREPSGSRPSFSQSTARRHQQASVELPQRDSKRSLVCSRTPEIDASDPAAAPATPAREIAALADAGRYEEALERAQAEPRPWPAALRAMIGILLLNLDRPEEALGSFRQAVYLAPEEVDWRHWLAVAFERIGRSGDAARELRNAAPR